VKRCSCQCLPTLPPCCTPTTGTRTVLHLGCWPLWPYELCARQLRPDSMCPVSSPVLLLHALQVQTSRSCPWQMLSCSCCAHLPAPDVSPLLWEPPSLPAWLPSVCKLLPQCPPPPPPHPHPTVPPHPFVFSCLVPYVTCCCWFEVADRWCTACCCWHDHRGGERDTQAPTAHQPNPPPELPTICSTPGAAGESSCCWAAVGGSLLLLCCFQAACWGGVPAIGSSQGSCQETQVAISG
jgi:hypothetical protein